MTLRQKLLAKGVMVEVSKRTDPMTALRRAQVNAARTEYTMSAAIVRRFESAKSYNVVVMSEEDFERLMGLAEPKENKELRDIAVKMSHVFRTFSSHPDREKVLERLDKILAREVEG